MAKVTIYPVGHGDSILQEFNDGRLLLLDYCDMKDPNDKQDKRIDLPGELRSVLDEKDRDAFDVAAFTHADDDHVHGLEDFFWLDHAEEYQEEDRIKIHELWVPALFITEEGLVDSARILRQEARYRLKEDYGIRVFSKPGGLDAWLRDQGISPESRANRISRAGGCVPGFTATNGQVEIFVHSPFSFRSEEDAERNEASLVLHSTFYNDGRKSRFMFGADAEHETWKDIVRQSKSHGNEERLDWDGFKISHHCSHDPLSADRGTDKTKPDAEIDELFKRGATGCLLISSNEPIPAGDTTQPPHRQAAAYYREIADSKGGEFIVTMENPSKEDPKPTVIEVGPYGLKHKKRSGIPAGAAAVVAKPSPRMG